MYYGYEMPRQQGTTNNLNTQYQTMVDPFVVQTFNKLSELCQTIKPFF
ncbi:hypothetical protein [Litchfieldia salsa]|uniref:Uncharacterized protein n=1 Tax=Litchfieldia salsa TaxID=930152 RepID=A0A1H0P9D1_9BACI|nr:hypothetical protein [Litchfieldia salsa]SDP01298.1 hypothetical protein SAMN05216565_101205 [Litchfieldia salsa]